ncbi:MAG: butyrate kinase [candidate division KSB1 bacterium]|nr:butyrate kinase [candidate division KSB1 bacterium]
MVKTHNGQQLILVINPGSTSTKVALFSAEEPKVREVLTHRAEELAACPHVWDQFELRRAAIQEFVGRHGVELSTLAAVAGRGGLFRSVKGGTYLVNERMLADARANLQGEHVSNLGCALAFEFASQAGVNAYVTDPVSVDEFEPLARYSGHPLIERRALAHALSIHEVARRSAAAVGKPLAESSFVVAHLGGGISIAPVKGGRIIDVNDASSDGPFSPERTGGLPLQPFITLCFSGRYSEKEMRSLVMGKGGLIAYLGTSSAEEVERRIGRGDQAAREVYEAMAYQIAKEIGAMATVLGGRVDGIVLTGGLARSSLLADWVRQRVEFIAPVTVMPGEFEMEAMVAGVLRVLRGEEPALVY